MLNKSFLVFGSDQYLTVQTGTQIKKQFFSYSLSCFNNIPQRYKKHLKFLELFGILFRGVVTQVLY